MTMPASARRNQPNEHLTDAELNELVDGALSAGETERARMHLATCADCDERYRTLRATVSALRTAPSLMPRRSFHLTPAQAEQPERVPGPFDRFSEWLLPGLPIIRAATLAVALLLISVTAIDLIIHRDSGQESAGPALMQMAPQDQESEPALMREGEGETSVAIPTNIGAVTSGGAGKTPPASTSIQSAADDSVSEPTGASESVAPAPADISDDAELGESMAPALQAVPPATPAVTSPVPSPAATPAVDAESGRGGASVSRWRIAELGLLLLLLWLGVSWLARSRADMSIRDEAPLE